MIIVMKDHATAEQIAGVVTQVEAQGFRVHLSQGEERTIIGVIGDERPVEVGLFEVLDGVERTVPILKPYKLASREMHPADTLVPLDGLKVGGPKLALIAGPCSVESRSQILETAQAVKEAGATALRGGAYKPRTSPYAFQGLGEEGLELLAEARNLTGLPIVSEAMSEDQVAIVARYADVIQIGARNMQNYPLLNTVGKSGRPVLLKRGMMSTIEELLMAAEYILAQGNTRVMLCERGIRTFEKATRNTTDINAIPVLKRQTHLPVILDPSHGTGKVDYVAAVAKAGIAAGADGLIIEVHSHPEQALSDGGQSLRPEAFAKLVKDLRRIAEAVDRNIG
ncbi:MAG TPA: 3-deoxy-7-phosphoheptulonate synthase [Anaerolineales bacterium]|nr:3-deoxy-7-phosphoheptulonate synthase [Anaerolineales bacterium]